MLCTYELVALSFSKCPRVKTDLCIRSAALLSSVIFTAADIIRRGIWGMYLATLPIMALSAAFQSQIKTEDSSRNIGASLAPDFALFDLKREWSVRLPEGATEHRNSERQGELESRVWTPEQSKELSLIASELLQAYVRGGKDRRKHTVEKHITFIETDSKLEVRVAVSYLTRRRQRLLGLRTFPDAELVFTFTDAGGAFRPFMKVPGSQRSVGIQLPHPVAAGRASAEGANAERSEREATEERMEESPMVKPSSNTSDDRANSLGPFEATGAQENEERITHLQLLWKKTAEPQHEELRRVAVANVLWDVALSSMFLVTTFLILKVYGFQKGRCIARVLKERRTMRLAAFGATDADVLQNSTSEVEREPVGLQMSEETVNQATANEELHAPLLEEALALRKH